MHTSIHACPVLTHRVWLSFSCRHLSKSADQIRKDQAAALSALQRKIEAAKGAAWAQQAAKDLKAIADYDAAWAADPVNGPKVAVA